MRHSLISSRVFTLITLSWCLLAELLTLPCHIHQSHWYRWSPSWAVISPLSSKPSENMDRMAVCCQIPSQDTLLSSKKSQCRHRYRNTPSTAVPVWVSPSIVYFRTRLYWTLTELWAFGGSFHLAGPCKKKSLLEVIYFFNCDLSYFWFTCAHTAHVLDTRVAAKPVSAHSNWKRPIDGSFSSFQALLPHFSPTLSSLICLWLPFSCPLCLLGNRFLLPDSPSSPACSLSNYFTLTYMIISVWIMLLLSLPALICVFSMHVILFKICVEAGKELSPAFHTEYG